MEEALAAPQEEYDENEATGVELEQDDSDGDAFEDIRRPWNPESIRVSTKTFSLRNILDLLDERSLDLAPDFQRLQVWKIKQEAQLIESLLLQIPLPAFYFAEDADGSMRVVDGLQRLSTVQDFVVGGSDRRGGFRLRELEYIGDQAGFALLRHGRAVRGWIDSWRPEEIFGDARNDTLNQRLAGELVMDDFRASHTKDAIDWEDDDEEELGKELKKLCGQYDLLREAKKKTSGGPPSAEDDRERQEAAARLAEQLKSQKVEDTIRLLDVPKPELAKLAAEPLLDAVEHPEQSGLQALAIWEIGSGRKAYLYGVDLSPNDPYFEYEVLANADLKIVINERHPALDLLSSAEARLAHYHHVALDAVAEWKCAQLSEPLVPESIRLMKDRLFRAVADSDQTE